MALIYNSRVNSPESAVCHVTGVDNGNNCVCLRNRKIQQYPIILPNVYNYVLKLENSLTWKMLGAGFPEILHTRI